MNECMHAFFALCATTGVLLIRAAFCQLTVLLYNDSPFPLKAVVHAADGRFLGEEELKPLEQKRFHVPETSYAVSETPFSVLWYCKEGTLLAFCPSVSPGQLAAPLSCKTMGMCKFPKAPKE